MRKVTQEDIKTINKLYAELKSYAAVSRVVGFAPSTVKKYVVQDYVVVDESKIERFNKPLPDLNTRPFLKEDWGDLCVITEEEFAEIRNLWEEMEI